MDKSLLRKEKAVLTFKSGYNCAQAVFSSFAAECGFSSDTACKLTTGFGGGVARHGELCGAVSGAVLVVSSLYGRGENDPKDNMEFTYHKTQELMSGFRKKMGTVSCKELLRGCDLLTPEGQQEFNDNNYGKNICIPCVEAAVELLEELINQECDYENCRN